MLKKLVEKASFVKKPRGDLDGLKPDDVNLRCVFHYGIPSGSVLAAYDSLQKIVALATKDGRIKLFGKDSTQALLVSSDMVSSKFLQFMENQGLLININSNNRIEVWDVEQRYLCNVHDFDQDITSFTLIQHTPYLYLGDSSGHVSVMKVDKEPCHIEKMKYSIPLSASHGLSDEVSGDAAVTHILPQPAAESKRVAIVYKDGVVTLWSIRESKAIFITGGSPLQSIGHETKRATTACWCCPYGSKLVVGYSNGEIFIWSIPATSNSSIDQELEEVPSGTQSAPICKLNLGYKLDKVPIAKLIWSYAEGKTSRLYAMGSPDCQTANLLQVVLLNEHTESRTIKLGLHPPEPCVDMEIIASFPALRKNINNSLLLVSRTGQIYTYDDSLIERYLIQSQSRSPPSLPREVKVKLPLVDSSITIAKFVVNNPYMLFSTDQDYIGLIKDSIPLFPFERGQKDGTGSNSTPFSKAKNVFFSGHSNGAINLWDVSCPNPRPIVSVTQQSEDNLSLSGVPLTALCLTSDLHILISGDQSGTVRIYKFKTEFFAPDTSFLSFQVGSKKGSNPIQSIKLVKVNGAVLSISTSEDSKYFAVGSDQGYVVLIDSDSKTILYQTHIASELCAGVISMQFNTCSLHGFNKNILVVATKDSSILALETETGNILSPSSVHPKKPSRALFMQILDEQELSGRGLSISDGIDMIKGNLDNTASKQSLVLICSEKAVYVYSLLHIIQGIKKVYYKKKFHSSLCCWASTFDTPETGLMLLFSNGKIEIRSLPELSLLKETSIRGLALSPSKANAKADHSVCASKTGELIVIDRDQEMFFVSVSLQNDTFRFLDFASKVYDRDLVVEPGQTSTPIIQKEKKKGIFGSVFKDAKGNKANNVLDVGVENARVIEEMTAIFSADNFPSLTHSEEKLGRNDKDADLDIDDIEIEDPEEKQKGNPMVAALNKQNLTNTFQALKGKFMPMKVKNDKASINDAPQDDKADTVGQIKKRYGYTASAEPSAAEAAKSKLSENLKKLQGISIRSAEMQDQAKSFSSLAKEVLRFSGNDKANS